MLKRNQGGFTLIELMVVIVIIGILVAIALPNFIGAQDRAKVSSVKSNMRTFQTMVETYGVDFGGRYPDTVDILEAAAGTGSYLKTYSNPFTGKALTVAATAEGEVLAEGIVYTDEPTTSQTTAIATVTAASALGQVVYRQPHITGSGTEAYTRYAIYGLDKAGVPVLDKGNVFTLSNV